MKKTVLIVGIASLFVFLVLTLIFPPCTMCAALLAGAAGGWLAAYWVRPQQAGQAASIGAQAGAISGVGALAGQLIGGVLNALLVGPENAAAVYRDLGFEPMQISGPTYYASTIGLQACCGIVNVGIMAGLGALAAFLYFRFSGGRSLGGGIQSAGNEGGTWG